MNTIDCRRAHLTRCGPVGSAMVWPDRLVFQNDTEEPCPLTELPGLKRLGEGAAE